MALSRTGRQASASKRRKGVIECANSISITNNEINNNDDNDNIPNAPNSQQHYSIDDILNTDVEISTENEIGNHTSSTSNQPSHHLLDAKILPEKDDYSVFLPETPHQMSDLDEKTIKLVLGCLFRNSAFAWFSRKWIYIPNHSREDAREAYLNLFEKFIDGYKFIDEGLDVDSVSIIKLLFKEINKEYKAFVLTSMDMGFDRLDRALRGGIRRFFEAINVDVKVFSKNKNKLYELECDLDLMRTYECFANLKDDNIISLFFVLAMVFAFLAAPVTANIDMNKLVKGLKKLLNGGCMQSKTVISLVQMQCLGVIASLLYHDSNGISLTRGTLIASITKNNLFGVAIDLQSKWMGKIPDMIIGFHSKKINDYVNKIAILRKSKQMKKEEKIHGSAEWWDQLDENCEPPGYGDI